MRDPGMSQANRVFQELSREDFAKIKTRAVERTYKEGELIFSEGDAADYVYFIESGEVSVFIQKFNSQEEICVLGPGAYFGEMAIFSNDKRTASVAALSDATLLSVNKRVFLEVVKTDQALADRINTILIRRNEELLLRENLVDITGIKAKHLHIGISGDPSLRETVFTRERYESVVDGVLPLLEPRLVDLLTNRCVYQVSVAFNSGEIRTSSIFDPFSDEVHQANKLVDEAYIDRHFAVVPFEEKASMIRQLYRAVAHAPVFGGLPAHFKKIFSSYYENWQPVTPRDIANTISRLGSLRSIPNYYLRHFTMSIMQDAIRMQFNCDGTHIVSAEDYQRFIEEMT
jgi:CRP-like cAMP-binding protein